MAGSVPEADRATPIKGALHESATPSGTVEESGQFLLGSPDARCAEAASRMCALVHDAQRLSGFSLSTVASIAGKDVAAVSRAFDAENPHTVLKLLAAVVLVDGTGTFTRGFARLSGREAVDRPRLTPEQKLARLEAYLRRRGKVGELEIAEAYGEDAP